MPSRMLPIADPAITRGMNTVDDPKILKPRECVRLLNAFPGNPPVPRNGCTGKVMIGTTTYRFIPPGIALKIGASVYVVVWIYDSATSKYRLTSVLTDGSGFYDLGNGTITAPVFFDLLELHSCIYSSISKTLTNWSIGGSYAGLGHKVVESNTIVRDLCIAEPGEIKSHALTAGAIITTGKWVEYACQYVRKNDAASFEAGATPTYIILPPNITATYQPKRANVFLPGVCIGVESLANRHTVELTGGNTGVDLTLQLGLSAYNAMNQGATHLRVYRCLEQNTEALAQGATKFFVFDLPLGVATLTFSDTVTNAALVGEENQLITGYSVAPPAAFIEYLKGRLYLMATDGRVYFSESVGGDGGTVLATAQAYSQPWASLFKPTTYLLDCDYVDGQQATGMERLGDDIFFWKERKIFSIFGGDPTSTPLSQVSNTVGCAFPYTLTKCEIKGMFGKCILFMGNDGPMVLEEGGRVRPFSEFKIKQLWPKHSQELYSELDTDYDWIVHNCTAAFFKDTWWVMYQTKAGVSRIFGYYFDPDLGADGGAPRGPLEFQFAEM
jgi:hypothetical protein